MSPGPRAILAALAAMRPDQVVEPGVTAGDALAVMTVPPVPDGCRYLPDQVFGTAGKGGRDLPMHLYARAGAGERAPGVVFVHGGGFVEGYPEMLIRYAAHLAARGYVTASIDYRLVGEARFPAALEDAKCAMRWMRANAGEIGLDPDRLGVAGGSAGGYLAAMIASTPGLFEGDGGNQGVPSGAAAGVLWYPAVDLTRAGDTPAMAVAVKNLFGADNDPRAAEASPITHAAHAPPTLTFTGDADPIVPIDHVRAYHDALRAAGVANELVVVPGAGHSFDFGLPRWEECFAALCSWFDEHLGA